MCTRELPTENKITVYTSAYFSLELCTSKQECNIRREKAGGGGGGCSYIKCIVHTNRRMEGLSTSTPHWCVTCNVMTFTHEQEATVTEQWRIMASKKYQESTCDGNLIGGSSLATVIRQERKKKKESKSAISVTIAKAINDSLSLPWDGYKK